MSSTRCPLHSRRLKQKTYKSIMQMGREQEPFFESRSDPGLQLRQCGSLIGCRLPCRLTKRGTACCNTTNK